MVDYLESVKGKAEFQDVVAKLEAVINKQKNDYKDQFPDDNDDPAPKSVQDLIKALEADL